MTASSSQSIGSDSDVEEKRELEQRLFELNKKIDAKKLENARIEPNASSPSKQGNSMKRLEEAVSLAFAPITSF